MASARPPHLRSPLHLGCLLLLVSGCTTAGNYKSQADTEVTQLIEQRRAQLRIAGAFTLEPRAQTLRTRLLGGGSAPVLTFMDTLAIAAENSRDVQSRKERLYLAALDLTLERWRFGVQSGLTLDAFVDGDSDAATEARADAALTFSKLLGDGTEVVASAGLDMARSLITSDGWNPVSDLGVTITRPLLAGAGTEIVQEPLTQAERDLVYEARAFERFRRTFAFDVATRWYRLLQTRDEVTNQEVNVKNLVQLSERNRALAEAGRLSELEFGQARQNELRSQNQLLSARERYAREIDAFALFLGLPVGTALELDPRGLSDLVATGASSVTIDEALAIDLALGERLDYKNTLGTVDDAQRRVKIAEDALQASLSLVVDASATSEAGQPLDYDADRIGWSAGLQFTAPWEKLPQRNAARSALINWTAAQREAERSEDTIRADLRDSLRQVRSNEESYAIQLNAQSLAATRVESARLSLDAGRADTRDLLEAEESLLAASNAATGALVDWVLARMSVYLDMERLQVDEGGILLLEPAMPAAVQARVGGMDLARRDEG